MIWLMSACTVLSCPPQAQRLSIEAKLFQGLGDPTRLAILKALAARPLRVIDLCHLTGRAQPSVSAHLACLRDCGLVAGDVKGRETYYSISEPELIAILKASERIATKVGPQICACALLPLLNQE